MSPTSLFVRSCCDVKPKDRCAQMVIKYLVRPALQQNLIYQRLLAAVKTTKSFSNQINPLLLIIGTYFSDLVATFVFYIPYILPNYANVTHWQNEINVTNKTDKYEPLTQINVTLFANRYILVNGAILTDRNMSAHDQNVVL